MKGKSETRSTKYLPAAGETNPKEIVDVVMNALRLANHYNVDFQKYWQKRLVGLHQKFTE